MFTNFQKYCRAIIKTIPFCNNCVWSTLFLYGAIFYCFVKRSVKLCLAYKSAGFHVHAIRVIQCGEMLVASLVK